MKCVKDKKGFLVVPETEFEEQVVASFQCNCESFVKCGVTPAEIIGIAIRHKANSDAIEDQQKQTVNTQYKFVDAHTAEKDYLAKYRMTHSSLQHMAFKHGFDMARLVS